MIEDRKALTVRVLALCGGSLMTALAASAAMAQTAPIAASSAPQDQAPTDAAAPQASDIVVTGSRISQRDYKANSPIATMSSATIASTGAITLEGSLSQLPQFTSGSGATTTGYFATGQASLNLRGLGPQRNLILLDGRRIQPSDAQQVVDINTIPRAIIENVEIITGGASAVYGSDAMAGVVNFTLKKHFTGAALDIEYNPTQRYSGAPQDYALTVGSDFADHRGNAVLSASYSKRGAIDFNSVPFYGAYGGGTDFSTGQGVYNPLSNAPSQAAVTSLFKSYGVTSTVPATSRLSFNPDGTIFGATNGLANYKGGLGLRPSANGQNIQVGNISSTVQTPLERYTLFGRANYDVTPDIEVFAQGSYVTYNSATIAEAGNTSLVIPVSNPFIPTNLATLLASRANPNASFAYTKRFYEAGPRVYNRSFDVFQLTAGVDGKINAIDGTWEIYGTHGSTREVQDTQGSVVASALSTLLNAKDGGASICAGGYNPFGLTTLSAACNSYLTRDPIQVTTITQDVAEATAQGRLFKLPAGDLRFAVGGSYRADSYAFRPDSDISQGTIVGVSKSGASSGSTNVYEGYAELLVPVLADLPFIQKFDVDLAYRYSKYNLSGGVSAYKADASWSVLDQLRLRGGYQRAVRAPNVGELFLAPTAGFGLIGDPATGNGDPCNATSKVRAGGSGAQVAALCVQQGVPAGAIGSLYTGQANSPTTNVGNTKLVPETADTFTLGLVASSPFSAPVLRGFRMSVDYYNIGIKNVIGTITAMQSLGKCFNTDGSNPNYSATNTYCQLITRDPNTGLLLNILQPTLNLGQYKTSGLDFELDWQAGLQDLGLNVPGKVLVKSLVSRLLEFKLQAVKGGNFLDYSNTVGPQTGGAIGSLPKLKATTTVTYQNAVWNLGLSWLYTSPMRSLATVTDRTSTTPGTRAYNLFNLFGNISINKNVSVGAGVNNLFDCSPPVVDGRPGFTEPSVYDVLGRSFFISAHLKI